MTQELETTELQLYRLRLVQAYVDSGLDTVVRTFQLEPAAIRQMQTETWWADCASQVFNGQAEKLDRKFTELIDLALTEAEDRLRNGDKVVDKFGDENQVPVKGKDAAHIAATLLDRRQVLRGLPSSILRQEVRLEDLARKLESFAPAPRPKESTH